jgi:methylated-DNA-protein-cysteine methyltransferase-like protein
MFAEMLAKVRRIPKGRVSTYGEVAAASGHPGAARQVVWALRSGGEDGNGIPWHRVVGAGGRIRLTGENGFEQRLRLQSEGVVIAKDKIDLKRYGHSFSPVKLKKSGKSRLRPHPL